MGNVRHGESPALYRDQNYDVVANQHNLEVDRALTVAVPRRRGSPAT